jgi:hypothetical protein
MRICVRQAAFTDHLHQAQHLRQLRLLERAPKLLHIASLQRLL